ncbi:MAG: UvrD-helicase domain-containing protein [Deltaproteobacteria bacterium]|nr:UvrD-helicase domain-containing protein [Deltaproteobacteria bacterium]
MATSLNPSQQAAVQHDHGPLLVLAGAGSGKTGVVTQRISRLIREGTPAHAILAMTFTNKAAAEMQERVVKLAGPQATKGLFACTFHRFGLEVLTRETKALALRGGAFAIFDRGDCTSLVRDALREIVSGRSHDVGAILNRISLAKNAFLDAESYAAKVADSDDDYDAITAQVYPRYEAMLRSLQAFDFDDLVTEPVKLWRRVPDVLERWKQRYRFLIVDEYQDTNVSQLELLRLLAEEHRNLCVVGDDDQAIYAWRGADVRNILDFEQHFPGAKVVRLEQNYRSSEAVLTVANAVLASSRARRHGKTLRATKGKGAPVTRVVMADAGTEAAWVADRIQRLVSSGEARPRDVAILYRSNLQAPELEGELRARGIAHRVFGGTQTFERKEIKDLLAYLTVAVAPDASELAVRRTLNYPARGIGEVALERLGYHATAHDLSLWAAVERPHAVAELSDAARQGCRDYMRIVGDLARDVETLPMAEATRRLVERIGLKAQIWAECGQNIKAAGRRWASVEILLRIFDKRDRTVQAMPEAQRPNRKYAMAQMLRLLMLREDSQDENGGDFVTMVTMHGAKGLEFRYVFAVGLEEGLMPHARTLEERVTDPGPVAVGGEATDEIEQERRLFYVCVTRAKEHLFLCHSRARVVKGKVQKRAPSRFLLDIPESLYETLEVSEPPRGDPAVEQQGVNDVLAAILNARGPV